MTKCERCFRALVECQDCKGGRLGGSCSTCGGTGRLCMEHGKHWQR